MIDVALLALLRFVAFTTGALLLGASLFALYAPAEARPSRRRVPLRRWASIAAGALLALAIAAWLPATAIGFGDPADPQPLADTIGVILVDTGFGRAWCVQFAASLALLGALVVRAPAWPISILAALALASEAWIGHAGMGSGVDGDLRLLAMVVHILAAGAWLGGLVPLAATTARGKHAVAGPSLVDAITTLRRFSRMGYVAVALILISGVANTVFLVIAAGTFAVAYALVLAVKLVLATFLVSIALANRVVITPRLSGDDATAAFAELHRNVVLEQLLGVLVLACVSMLGLLAPSVS